MKRQLIPKGTIIKKKKNSNYYKDYRRVEIVNYQCGFYRVKLIEKQINTHHEVRNSPYTFIEASQLYRDYEVSLKSLKNL